MSKSTKATRKPQASKAGKAPKAGDRMNSRGIYSTKRVTLTPPTYTSLSGKWTVRKREDGAWDLDQKLANGRVKTVGQFRTSDLALLEAAQRDGHKVEKVNYGG